MGKISRDILFRALCKTSFFFLVVTVVSLLPLLLNLTVFIWFVMGYLSEF